MVIPYASNTTSKESSERYNDHGKLSTFSSYNNINNGSYMLRLPHIYESIKVFKH